MFASQGKGAMKTDKFASYVVGKVLGRGQEEQIKYVRAGQYAWRFWLMGWLSRAWVLSYLAKRLMDLPL